MTKSEMFVKSHKETREIKKVYPEVNYKTQFGLCLSQIMKGGNKMGTKDDYAEFVKKHMATAKTKINKNEITEDLNAVEMKYSEYKNNYAGCKTVSGSYDKKQKTIKVITNNGFCQKCKTYCYGDCQA